MIKSTAPHVLRVTAMMDSPSAVYVFIIYIICSFRQGARHLLLFARSEGVCSEDIHLVVVDLHESSEGEHVGHMVKEQSQPDQVKKPEAFECVGGKKERMKHKAWL